MYLNMLKEGCDGKLLRADFPQFLQFNIVRPEFTFRKLSHSSEMQNDALMHREG